MTQKPQDWTSEMIVLDPNVSSQMSININASSNGLLNVLVTDYGKTCLTDVYAAI